MSLDELRSTSIPELLLRKGRTVVRLLACALVLFPLAASAGLDDRIVVFLADPADSGAIAKSYRLTPLGQGRVDRSVIAYRVRSYDDRKERLAALARDSRVVEAFADDAVQMKTMYLPPNDELFHPDGGLDPAEPDSNLMGQWHLYNELGFPSIHADQAWEAGSFGDGVTLGVVDSGVDHAHNELRSRYSAAASFDFVAGDFDAGPEPSQAFRTIAAAAHGTEVAGVAAAGENQFGVVGVAPDARVASLRVPLASSFAAASAPADSSLSFIDAILHDRALSFRLWGGRTIQLGPYSVCDPRFASVPMRWVKNHSYGTIRRFADVEARVRALEMSTDCGVIHVYAAGNERGTVSADSNTSDQLTTPASITVAAVGYDGRFADYSNFGANVFVSAPSSASTDTSSGGITTTDRRDGAGINSGFGADLDDGDYTSRFGGTSSASPTVAGSLALVRSIRPDLTTRLAKHLLVRTARIVDDRDRSPTSDGGWRRNRAGFAFNQNYGFGLVDAGRLVNYPGLDTVRTTSLRVLESRQLAVHRSASTRNCADCTVALEITSKTLVAPAEEVMVTVDIEHPDRGEFEIELISPSGTRTRLLKADARDTGQDLQWRFLTNALWGENVVGKWQVRVFHPSTKEAFAWRWRSVQIRAHSGTLVP